MSNVVGGGVTGSSISTDIIIQIPAKKPVLGSNRWWSGKDIKDTLRLTAQGKKIIEFAAPEIEIPDGAELIYSGKAIVGNRVIYTLVNYVYKGNPKLIFEHIRVHGKLVDFNVCSQEVIRIQRSLFLTGNKADKGGDAIATVEEESTTMHPKSWKSALTKENISLKIMEILLVVFISMGVSKQFPTWGLDAFKDIGYDRALQDLGDLSNKNANMPGVQPQLKDLHSTFGTFPGTLLEKFSHTSTLDHTVFALGALALTTALRGIVTMATEPVFHYESRHRH